MPAEMPLPHIPQTRIFSTVLLRIFCFIFIVFSISSGISFSISCIFIVSQRIYKMFYNIFWVLSRHNGRGHQHSLAAKFYCFFYVVTCPDACAAKNVYVLVYFSYCVYRSCYYSRVGPRDRHTGGYELWRLYRDDVGAEACYLFSLFRCLGADQRCKVL